MEQASKSQTSATSEFNNYCDALNPLAGLLGTFEPTQISPLLAKNFIFIAGLQFNLDACVRNTSFQRASLVGPQHIPPPTTHLRAPLVHFIPRHLFHEPLHLDHISIIPTLRIRTGIDPNQGAPLRSSPSAVSIQQSQILQELEYCKMAAQSSTRIWENDSSTRPSSTSKPAQLPSIATLTNDLPNGNTGPASPAYSSANRSSDTWATPPQSTRKLDPDRSFLLGF